MLFLTMFFKFFFQQFCAKETFDFYLRGRFRVIRGGGTEGKRHIVYIINNRTIMNIYIL